MEKRVASSLAALRRRRNAILTLIRALEEYALATRSGTAPRRVKTLHHRRVR